jgi:hypothetical protein
MTGLRGCNGTDNLFSLRSKTALPLAMQMKAKVFAVFGQIWAFFLETLYTASYKRERRHILSIHSS